MIDGSYDVHAVCLALLAQYRAKKGEINGVVLCASVAVGAVYLAPTIMVFSWAEW